MRAMLSFSPRHLLLAFFANVIINKGFAEASAQNLSCYQCVRTTNTECSPDELLPCPSSSDRCVTHIMKDKEEGYKLKRECGLGPCTFTDLMMTKGLGLDSCDRSRHEYFCIFCCRESGCNKDAGTANAPTLQFVIFNIFFVVVMLNYRL